ncbi:hypothetical protein [Streptomyces sp. NPDC059009]|uniref:hypothetical protein n=1 Tax=Streptomyces sp. NPDC059009 TaxID=3346694 RepID=UPI0036A4F75D
MSSSQQLAPRMEPGDTVHETDSLVCPDCANHWVEEYDVLRTVDYLGVDRDQYSVDGRRVPTPSPDPVCAQCGGTGTEMTATWSPVHAPTAPRRARKPLRTTRAGAPPRRRHVTQHPRLGAFSYSLEQGACYVLAGLLVLVMLVLVGSVIGLAVAPLLVVPFAALLRFGRRAANRSAQVLPAASATGNTPHSPLF